MRDSYGSYLIEDSSIADRQMNIILDFGVKFSKIGYAGEIEPRKIIKTPALFDYEKFFNESVKYKMQPSEESPDIYENLKLNNSNKNIVSYLRNDYQKLRLELEEFLHNALYNNLQIQKQKNNKNYSVVLLVDPFLEKLDKITELLVKIVLENPNIQAVKIFPKNITPVYCTGFPSGIVFDAGYLTTSIIPVNEGLPYLDKIQNINLSCSDLEKELKIGILEENVVNPVTPKLKIKNVELFSESLNYGLEDILTRAMFCVSKKISELLKNPAESSKLRAEFTKVDYLNSSFVMSMAKRVQLGTRFFGDYANSDEINFAYELLKSIKNLPCEDRKKLAGNIILNGGLTMTIGFYKRLIEEMNSILDQNTSEDSEFFELQAMRQDIKIHKVLFPRNNLSWIGCSILFNLDSINAKHLTISREDLENENLNPEMRKAEDDFIRRSSSRFGSIGAISSTFKVTFKKYEISKEIPLLNKILGYFRDNK